MYARDVAGQPQPLTFGVSGKLIMNVLVMYDRETDTLWSQILGKGVAGELAGTTLTPLAATQMNWGQWKELHPDTLALRKGYNSSNDPYNDYYIRDSAGVIGETRSDDRLNRKALGIGVVVNDQPGYFPISALRDSRIANDEVGGEPVLVVFHPDAFSGLVFARTVAGETLTFSLEEGEAEPPILVDAETGSRWSSFDGLAIDGPLAGRSLPRIPSTTSFWFGWKDWHPDTYLYEPEGGG